MENAKDIRDWCEEQWASKGLLNSGHRNVFVQGPGGIHTKAGSAPTYKSKEQKAYEARFQLYNKKLTPIILAEATQTVRNMEVPIINKYGRPEGTEVKCLPEYRWPAHATRHTRSRAPAESKASTSIPRKRVPKAKLEQAAAIIAKVPEDELATFLARFGLSLSLAASIASLGDVEMIARQFLRATL